MLEDVQKTQEKVKMDEEQIMQLLRSDYTWEQIIYKIIGFEGLNPWDLDLTHLSAAFVKYITSIKEMNFRVPAKYIIIAAVLLRMKSDQLRLIEIINEEAIDPMAEAFEANGNGIQRVEAEPLEPGPARFAKRRVMVPELISALQRVLKTEERKQTRLTKRKDLVKIEEEDITKRIERVYASISSLLDKIKEREVQFSRLVKTWNRQEILNHFLPLLYLDHQGKVQCRQDEMFEEIFISRKSPATK